MHILDIVSKILVAISAAIGVWLLPRLGMRQRQLQVIDFATKRITFWDTYLKVGLSAMENDSTGRAILQEEVKQAIQRVRVEATQELRRVSWYTLLTNNRIPAVELKGLKKLPWVFWELFLILFTLLFVGLQSFYVVCVFQKTVTNRDGLSVAIVTLVLIGLAVFCWTQAEKISHPKPQPIIEDI